MDAGNSADFVPDVDFDDDPQPLGGDYNGVASVKKCADEIVPELPPAVPALSVYWLAILALLITAIELLRASGHYLGSA